MNIGIGYHQRYVIIVDLFNVVGKNVCAALPRFHAMTECDYIPGFFLKGKHQSFREYQLVFQNLTVDDVKKLDKTFTTLEKLQDTG